MLKSNLFLLLGAALLGTACNHENDHTMTPANGTTSSDPASNTSDYTNSTRPDTSGPGTPSPDTNPDTNSGPGTTGISPETTGTGPHPTGSGSGPGPTGAGPGTNGSGSGSGSGATGSGTTGGAIR